MATVAKDVTIYVEGDLIRLAKDTNNEWRVVLCRTATSAEATANSAKQITRAAHGTGIKE